MIYRLLILLVCLATELMILQVGTPDPVLSKTAWPHHPKVTPLTSAKSMKTFMTRMAALYNVPITRCRAIPLSDGGIDVTVTVSTADPWATAHWVRDVLTTYNAQVYLQRFSQRLHPKSNTWKGLIRWIWYA